MTANARVIAATGVPASIFGSIARFDDFLLHGHFDDHAEDGRIDVGALTPEQYDALVTLTESYFAAGYEWFTPLALREDDRDRLGRRFDR